MKCLSEIPGPEQIAVRGHPSVRLDTSLDLMLGRSKRHLGKRVLATILAIVSEIHAWLAGRGGVLND
jgi:hypothetical protein